MKTNKVVTEKFTGPFNSFPSNSVNALLGLVILFYIIYIGQDIIVPFVFSIIIAILLNPFVNFLTKRKLNRVIAILVTILLAMCLAAGLMYFILSQLSKFGETVPLWREKFNEGLKQSIQWTSASFNLSPAKLNGWVSNVTKQGMNNSSSVIGSTLTAIVGYVVTLILIPVYIFLILFYKQLLLHFISRIFPKDKHRIVVVDVLHETKVLIQSYLIGLLIETAIVATLNSVSLLIIGIDYAILIGIICALLNIIPYIGGIIAVVMTMLFALLTKSPVAAILVVVAHLSVQFIDNTFLLPKVVGSKVKINALASIVAVLLGGAFWGVPGMFLSIPLTAILKVIFDRIEPMKPVGYLLGDEVPAAGKDVFHVKKTKPIKVES